MREERLKHVAEIRVSNVDKKSTEGDTVVRLCNYTDIYYNDRITGALDFMEATATLSQRTAFALRLGDVVITKDSETPDDIGASSLVAEELPNLVCGYHLAIVRPRTGRVLGAYLRWALSSTLTRQRMSTAATGVTRYGLRSEAIADLPVPIPPIATQRAVAGYLDREAARIDALVAAKQRMVVLLEERRRAAREAMVAQARRGSSALRLGFLLQEVDERLGDRQAPPLLSVSIHRGVIPFADANPDRVPRADDLGSYKRCRPDDIVLNRMRAFQGGVGRAMVDGIVSPDYAVLRPSNFAVAGYLEHLLRSPWFVGQMERLLRGIGGVDQSSVRTPRVNWDDLRTVPVPAPPVNRQAILVNQLDLALSNSWEVQGVIERQIAKIQERRQSLITAAVTGQLGIGEAT